jgi:uncharacterized iron-regulated membrane protein
MTRLFLQVHKWVGIALGVLVFIWLASGVVMVLPMKLVSRAPRLAEVDVNQVALSPSAAAALLPSREGDSSGVRDWALLMIGGEAYYRLVARSGTSYLINAATGTRLVIDQAQAEAIALRGLPAPLPVAQVTEVKARSLGYPNGPIPAWRVEFGDPRHTVAYVGQRDGSVGYSTGMHRVRYFIAQLHTFDQLKTLGLSRGMQHGVLAVTSAVAILLVFTGYYLVLPRRWRRRWERRPGGVS